MLDKLGYAIQVVGGLAAIVVLIVGAGRYFGRREAEGVVSADQMRSKADRVELMALEKRMDTRMDGLEERFDAFEERIEKVVSEGIARLERAFREDTAKNTDEHRTAGEAVHALAVAVGRLDERLHAMTRDVGAVNNRIEAVEKAFGRRAGDRG